MFLPESFTINTQTINIIYVDKLETNRFGDFNSITNEIRVAKSVKDEDGEYHKLKDEQILNTLFHEIFHAWQFYSGHEMNEDEPCTYAGYMIEFLRSTGLLVEENNSNE